MRQKPSKFGPFTTLVIKLDHDRAFLKKYKKDPLGIMTAFEKTNKPIPPRFKALIDPRSRTKLSDDAINDAIDAENRGRHRRRRGHAPGGGTGSNGGAGGVGGPPPPPLTHVGLANQLQGGG
jgi:hypothetical protein